MNAPARWARQAVTWCVILAALFVLAACVLVPRLGGATPYTIVTGSMKPGMPPGTLVVARPTPFAEIKVGDVITYQLKSGDPTVVTHRVVGVTGDSGERRLQTQGDANNAPDPQLVRPEQVRGVKWYSLPWVGRLNIALDNAQHQLVVWGAAGGLLLYAGYSMISAAQDRRRNRSTKTSDEQDEVLV